MVLWRGRKLNNYKSGVDSIMDARSIGLFSVISGQILNSLKPATDVFGFSPSHFLAGLLLIIAAVPSQAAINFINSTPGSGIVSSGTSMGASWGDMNGDGWPDLWLGNHLQAQPGLYINNGNGNFTNIAGNLNLPRFDKHGAAWADFDNDGDQDMILTVGANSGSSEAPNRFFENINGSFSERAVDYGLDFPLARARSPQWFDWNLDGKLDLFIAGFPRPDNLAPSSLFTQNETGFTNNTTALGISTRATNFFSQIIHLASENRNALMIHGIWPNFPDGLYRYDSQGFTDVSQARIPQTSDVWDAAIGDFNNDLMNDIYLTRLLNPSFIKQMDNRNLYAHIIVRTEEKGISFYSPGDLLLDFNLTGFAPTEIFIGSAGTNPAGSSFIVTAAEAEGEVSHVPGVSHGIYISHSRATSTWKIMVSKNATATADFTLVSSQAITGLAETGFVSSDGALSDVLLMQSDSGFQAAANAGDLGVPSTCESAAAADFDNDMDLDLYLVCHDPVSNIPNQLFENLGNGQFSRVAQAGGAEGSMAGRGDSIALADYDQDGFIDMIIMNGAASEPFNNGPVELFKNTGNSNHWLEIDLEGISSNRDGIGARVIVTTPDGQQQLREQNGGMHKFTQNHQRLHFGLGNNRKVSTITIDWPNSSRQIIKNILADQIIRVYEAGQSSPAGMPFYQFGSEEGFFAWKDYFDGPYHFIVNGGGSVSTFNINLLSSKPIVTTTPVSIEPNDRLVNSTAGISLQSIISSGIDGMDVQFSPGAKSLISVSKEGISNPRQLRVGISGKPLAPSGFIGDLSLFPELADLSTQDKAGLYIGKEPQANRLNLRINGDGKFRKHNAAILCGTPLSNLTPISIETNDELITPSSHAVFLNNYLYSGVDGIDISCIDSTLVGITYDQETLTSPHLITAGESLSPQANAYWLPELTPYGEPGTLLMGEDGIFIWKDVQGSWHLRITSSAYRTFTGTLRGNALHSLVQPHSLEANDILDTGNPQNITFSLNVGRNGVDGFDFAYPADATLELDISSPANASQVVFLGEARTPILRLPLDLSGWK